MFNATLQKKKKKEMKVINNNMFGTFDRAPPIFGYQTPTRCWCSCGTDSTKALVRGMPSYGARVRKQK
ncbi:unnamed protein product [Ixodes persulcatus]